MAAELPIQYFVFMKAETTGRHWEDSLQTKIVELNMIAINRRDLETVDAGNMPAAIKLNMIFCPGRGIEEGATNSHDLTVNYVQNSLSFQESAGDIVAFLQQLPKPVCLVAHNGGSFDFKHLKREFIDAGITLPEDLLCVDSMWIFYYILKSDPMQKITKAMKLENTFKILFGQLVDTVSAESKTLMLLDCVILKKNQFLELAEQKKKLFSSVKLVGEKTATQW